MKQATRNPYVGEILRSCMIKSDDFLHTCFTVVSGEIWNPCGHGLLCLGGKTGKYFHIAELRGMPRFMNWAGYQRYLRENGKKELTRTHIAIRNRADAMLKLETLLAKPWNWYAVPNNCASFVEDVVRAGGSSAGLYFNCPSIERFK